MGVFGREARQQRGQRRQQQQQLRPLRQTIGGINLTGSFSVVCFSLRGILALTLNSQRYGFYDVPPFFAVASCLEKTPLPVSCFLF